jgi:hypothetical protein
MSLSNADYVTTWAMPSFTHPQDFSDFIKREPKRFGLTNEPQSLQVGF